MNASIKASVALSLLAASFSVACSVSTEDGESADAVRDVFTSTYTSTKDACTVEAATPEAETSSRVCAGLGGYSVVIHETDGRSTVSLRNEKGIDTNLDLPGLLGTAVTSRTLGPNVEWRIPFTKGKPPVAMYFRVIDQKLDGKAQHNLVVVKLTDGAPCVYKVVEASQASATANQTARDAEDQSVKDICPNAAPVEGTSHYSQTGGGNCKETSVGEEHATTLCTGLGAYSLEITDRIGVGRSLVSLVKGEDKFDLGLEAIFEGSRIDTDAIGPNAEWRTPKESPSFPYSLSLRQIRTVDATGKIEHHLVVYKLNDKEPCLFATVEASKNSATANVTAREQMDRARTAACPKIPAAL